MKTMFGIGQIVAWKKGEGLLRHRCGGGPLKIVNIKKAEEVKTPYSSICICGDLGSLCPSHPQVIYLRIKGKITRVSGTHLKPTILRKTR